MTRRKIIPYNAKLVPLARKRRANMSLEEVLLWNELKQKKIGEQDFDRQKPILNYIVDFYCKDLMLAIEVDDASHQHREEEDERRQKEIESYGVTFLRFTSKEIRENMRNVIRDIEHWINENWSRCKEEPTPNPSREGKKVPGKKKDNIN